MCQTDLYKCPSLLTQCIIVLKLHCNCFVTVHSSHLHVCSCVHIDGTKEVCGPETLSTERIHRIRCVILKPNRQAYFIANVFLPMFGYIKCCFFECPISDFVVRIPVLPVLVRTRIMASNPMVFSTSRLRSLRKC